MELYDDEAWLREQYLDKKLSEHKIAHLLGCSRDIIHHRMDKFKIARRSRSDAVRGCLSPSYKRPQFVTNDWLDIEYNTKERSLMQIADELNVSSGIVHRWMIAAGIKRRSISQALSGIHHPMNGKRHGIATLEKLRLSHLGVLNPRTGIKLSDEIKQKISASNSGERSSQWRGGVSFEPYCPKFNEHLKEEIRNKYDRTCQKCNERENGRKLDVHHINFDKQAGCYGKPWNLIPLHKKCHAWTTNHRFEAFQLFYNHWATNPEINFNLF